MAIEIRICEQVVPSDLPKEAMQNLLREHASKFKGTTPLCLCTPGQVKMYIARVGDTFVLKRWPNSRLQHRADCPRYEAPVDASGLGKLIGSAITEDPIAGTVALKLGFSLKKLGRAAPADELVVEPGQEVDQKDGAAKAAANRMTPRSMLHYIWDASHLTIWDPSSLKRRNWPFVQQALKNACANMTTKGLALAGRVYIPEPWTSDRKDTISMQRRALMGRIATNKSSRELMMFLVEVKDLMPSQFGYKIVAKQVPDAPLYMSEAHWALINKRYETEIDMFMAEREKRHMVAFGTLSVKTSGSLHVEDIVLMMTNQYWIPVADHIDELLVDHSISAGRHFIKPLRYNLGPGRCVANVIYRDTPHKATSLYVTRTDDSDALQAGRDELIASGETNTLLLDIMDSLSFTDQIDKLPKDRNTSTSAYAELV